jgi:hypothetical protein
MIDLFDNVWGDRSEIVVDHCLDVTLPVRFPYISHALTLSQHLGQIALFVIGVAGRLYPIATVALSCTWTIGFGRQVTWTSDLVVPPGHQMTFKDALRILSNNLFVKILVPDWANNITKHTKKVHQAFIELKVCSSYLSLMYMRD